MNERLLQYIWQFQHFNKSELKTASGETLSILNQGQINYHQGPDFLHAKIRLGAHIFVGNIEMHIRASDWIKHQHDGDANYRNIILHVVWENDLEAGRSQLPTLELMDRIPRMLLQRYAQFDKPGQEIACRGQLHQVEEIVWKKWKEGLLTERLQRKSDLITQWLKGNGYNWEETLWWTIARSFGLMINADAFVAIAVSLPLNILKKHAEQMMQLEALLFGQSGLLENRPEDGYTRRLISEYDFLRNKYGLEKIGLPLHFLRMRPPSFPTVRLAQLASLLHTTGADLVSLFRCAQIEEVKRKLDVGVSEYWNKHFVFGETSNDRIKKTGARMIDSVLLNAVIPFLHCYGVEQEKPEYVERAYAWISTIRKENNAITTTFLQYGVRNEHAADSQALLELKTQYCDPRRCLECAIGREVLGGGRREE